MKKLNKKETLALLKEKCMYLLHSGRQSAEDVFAECNKKTIQIYTTDLAKYRVYKEGVTSLQFYTGKHSVSFLYAKDIHRSELRKLKNPYNDEFTHLLTIYDKETDWKINYLIFKRKF